MVMMGDPFVGSVSKKLSKEELVQAVRVDIAGELEAIMAYDAHAMATDDPRAKAILYSIRDEERQHVGELLHLMEILDPQEAQFLAKGKQEVDQLLAPKGQSGQQTQNYAQSGTYAQQNNYGQQNYNQQGFTQHNVKSQQPQKHNPHDQQNMGYTQSHQWEPHARGTQGQAGQHDW